MKNYYSNISQLFILCFLLICLFSCKNDKNKIEINSSKKQEIKISFLLSNVEDDINGTQSTITATLNEKNVEITKQINCNVIEKEEYDSKDIPLDATWACTCWWAGAGNNFYAQKMDNKVEIYKKEVYEEMKTEDEKWELFKTLE